MDGWVHGCIDRRMDGWLIGQTDGWMDGRTDGQTDGVGMQRCPPAVTSRPRRQMLDTEDELREMRSDAVPSEVRDWLAATFTQQARAKGRRAEEKPKFRSIVHAVQAGIFVERWGRGGGCDG